MEEWTAATDAPRHLSQQRITECDLCVLLVAFRRGHVPQGEELSITQLELQAAAKSGIDVLVFLLREDAPWPRKFDQMETDPGIRQWRQELQEHKTVGFFGLEPSSIEIASALTRWVAEKQKLSVAADSHREHVVLLKWLDRIPQQFDDYFRELWRAGFGRTKPPEEDADRLDRGVRELLRFYTRIVEILPQAFAQTNPSEQERGCFDEVFPAFQREATACFEASRTLRTGMMVPCSDGSKTQVGFQTLYSALEVSEHLRILRMAAEEIVIQFPIEQVEQARGESRNQLAAAER
jgi:hypothetical protein